MDEMPAVLAIERKGCCLRRIAPGGITMKHTQVHPVVTIASVYSGHIVSLMFAPAAPAATVQARSAPQPLVVVIRGLPIGNGKRSVPI
jgi:hypothetical protein